MVIMDKQVCAHNLLKISYCPKVNNYRYPFILPSRDLNCRLALHIYQLKLAPSVIGSFPANRFKRLRALHSTRLPAVVWKLGTQLV